MGTGSISQHGGQSAGRRHTNGADAVPARSGTIGWDEEDDHVGSWKIGGRQGNLSASEDLTIEGRVEGTITVGGHTLTVGHHGQIEAQIVARVATIRGTVHGDVTATEKVEILATGSLDGDVVAPRIAIAEGACFRGKMDIQPGNAE